MTPEELKAFELEHPEYKPLFRPIMTGFNQIVREEFSRTFKAIDQRLLALKNEHIAKFNMPEEDAKVLSEAFLQFMNQVDRDFKKDFMLYFESHFPSAMAAKPDNSQKADQ